MNKQLVYFLFFFSLLSSVQAQKENAAFGGNREKSARFDYSKNDFDSLFVCFFREPLPMILCHEYMIDISLLFSIDTAGNMSKMEFKNFEFRSPYRITINSSTPEGLKLYQELRDSIRKVMYLTKGMWNCRLKDGKKEDSKLLVSTRIRKNKTGTQEAAKDTSSQNNGVYQNFSIVELKTLQVNPDFIYNKGVAHLNAKKYSLAKIYFEQTLKTNPNDIDAFYNLGMCFLSMGNKQEACKNWDECFRLGDKSVLQTIKKNCDQ